MGAVRDVFGKVLMSAAVKTAVRKLGFDGVTFEPNSRVSSGFRILPFEYALHIFERMNSVFCTVKLTPYKDSSDISGVLSILNAEERWVSTGVEFKSIQTEVNLSSLGNAGSALRYTAHLNVQSATGLVSEQVDYDTTEEQ